jgi:hypothetical protein
MIGCKLTLVFEIGVISLRPGLRIYLLTDMAVKITIRTLRDTKWPMNVNGKRLLSGWHGGVIG